MGAPHNQQAEKPLTSERKIDALRILGVILIMATLVFATPLKQYINSAIHATYTSLHIRGEIYAGPKSASEAIFLVGDAGAMTDTVALALQKAISGASSPPILLYAGDNIYPLGMPKREDSSAWNLASSLLLKQIDPFRSSTRDILFVPGNHDWENHSADGWEAIKRENSFIESALGPGHILPPNGCPGPVRKQLFSDLQLIAVDSSWWLHEYAKPTHPDHGCPVFSQDGLVSELDSMLRETPEGVETVFLTHHPLLSAKSDHAHTKCPFSTDCPEYVSMREKLSSILVKYRPLLCVSGHNHALQIHREQSGCRTYAVSGGGSNVYKTKQPQTAEFAEASLGFMVLHRAANAAWNLDVIRVRSEDSLLPPSAVLAFSTSAR